MPGDDASAADALVLFHGPAAAEPGHHFDQMIIMQAQSAEQSAEP